MDWVAFLLKLFGIVSGTFLGTIFVVLLVCWAREFSYWLRRKIHSEAAIRSTDVDRFRIWNRIPLSFMPQVRWIPQKQFKRYENFEPDKIVL